MSPMNDHGVEPRTLELFRRPAEHLGLPSAPEEGRIARVGRVRLPLTLTARPWVTLYRYPDGRLVGVVRLPVDGHFRSTLVSPARLYRYARRSGLGRLEEDLDRLRAHALGGGSA
ncbi:MAG: hypothetical protein ACYDFT_06885 [Thermoplasmata archaeon]